MRNKFKLITFFAAFVSIGLAFQNCAEPAGNESSGVNTNNIKTADDNLLLVPKYFPENPTDNEILSTCTISNVARGMTLSILNRAGRHDCSYICSQNRLKFNRDYVSCSFGSVAIAGGGSATNFIESKHCIVESSKSGTLFDQYNVDKTGCISQCQLREFANTTSSSFRCLWQNQILYQKDANSSSEEAIGTCNIQGTMEDSVNNSTAQVAAISFSYDVPITRKQCIIARNYIGILFPRSTLNSEDSSFVTSSALVSITIAQ